MKKVIVVLVGVLVVVCGCAKEDGLLVCTNHTTLKKGFELDTNYSIRYEKNIVTILKTKEKIITDDQDELKQYKTLLEETYAPYNEVEYYSNKISLEDGILTSTTEINYQKIDIEKLLEIDSDNSAIVHDGQIKLKELKEMYEKAGAVCK